MFGALGLKKKYIKQAKKLSTSQSLYPQELREVSLLWFPCLLSMHRVVTGIGPVWLL